MSRPAARTEADVAASQTYAFSGGSVMNEIEEIEEEEEGGGGGGGGNCKYNSSREFFEINDGVMASIKEEVESSLFSFEVNNYNAEAENSVYVAVGKSESSMNAVSWALTHFDFVNTSTVLYLLHIFPEIRHVPSPLGMLPKNQVSPTQLENYMEQERGKRTQLLQKFLHICSASKVKVETVLIESDGVAKAILDLIPILNITKLVVGTSKSYPRKVKSRRGMGIADQIFQSAPSSCEVKVVCEGKEVIISQMIESPSPRGLGNQDNLKALQEADQHINDSFSCMCFKPKF